MKFLIPPSLLVNIYYSFIQSHLLYGNLIWTSPNTPMTGLQRQILKGQNIVNSVKELKLLNLHQIYKIDCCKLLFNHQLNSFNQTSNVHHHQTRLSCTRGMFVPHQVSKFFPLPNLACKYWNEYYTRSNTFPASIHTFIYHLKNKLLNLYQL